MAGERRGLICDLTLHATVGGGGVREEERKKPEMRRCVRLTFCSTSAMSKHACACVHARAFQCSHVRATASCATASLCLSPCQGARARALAYTIAY